MNYAVLFLIWMLNQNVLLCILTLPTFLLKNYIIDIR